MASDVNKHYIDILFGLKEKIRQSRLQATLAVHNELLKVYWEIGNTILQQQKNEGWGTKVIDRLIDDLKSAFPDMKGLSTRNIKYMRAFAEIYPEFLIVQQAVAQLPWGHNCAEYALRDTSKPIGIAEYKITQLLPDDIKGELPSIEELEEALGNTTGSTS